ncbi:heparan-alpha-glucosaminide N-acetyltransferase domain-containing protein [Brevibacillus formosus]|uniref:DUF418 domain-containing protein n=1 Tax=Brevibacillus TaxID=55080 RepID=UPI000D102DDB|nr:MULTISPECIES: heparan-alpha-glucosaminide N-acetyltransferase domain-containing protein [Brevibacillus]MBG9941870.1 membrane protein [Brevibacillus formosus]MED1945575.1 heparan-alpha-glucosaminide N-acetyltransferase domain-containing protein [Brevibacillus formosus]MED2000792.1 heparan-alpha-glucosaminide N-acetyltransferase domain-containing protein [Brevibacillus formosus]MED2084362.1 heparan-alpha-glucosaminide N-acetyltransferase domain-containing protein [Brevibacillus formosus]PSK15
MKVSSTRVIGLDFARAWAMLGMMIVNYVVILNAEHNGPDWLIALSSLFQGRASTVFVVLAGIGIAFMTKKARISGDSALLQTSRRVLWNRSLFLFVAGMLLYLGGWSGDILHYYGVYMLIASFLLVVSGKTLLLAFSGILLTAQALQLSLNYLQGWDSRHPFIEYLDFWTVEGFLRNLLYNGYHPVFPWMCFFLLGLWLGRRNLLDRSVRKKMLGWATALFVSLEVFSYGLIKLSIPVVGNEMALFLWGTKPVPPNLFYVLSSSSTAVIIILLCVSFAEKFANSWFTQTWVKTGQLTLTHYVSHIIIGLGFLAFIGRLENQTLTFAMLYAVGFFLFSIVLTLIWRRWFVRGPLESFMRKISG